MDRPDLLERVRAVDDELVDDEVSFDCEEPHGVDDLLVALVTAEPRMRARAASTLGRVAAILAERSAIDGRVIKALRAATGDAQAGVRCAALAALVRLSPEQLLPEMVKSLRADDARVVAGAAVVLGRAALLGTVAARGAVPNLVEAFKSDAADVGRAVAWALGCIGDRAVVPWLVAALGQRFVPVAAAAALGRLADPRAVPALLLALHDDDDDVRAAAARALGRLPSAPLQHLESLLDDPAPRVRLCAALALYERCEDAGPLARALDDADEPAAPSRRGQGFNP